MIRVRWDISEAVVLMDLFMSNYNFCTISDNDLLRLSQMFKRRADELGIVYDDKFRNLHGMRMQIECIRYVVSEGKEGMKNASQVFYQANDMRENDPEQFVRILKGFYRQYQKSE